MLRLAEQHLSGHGAVNLVLNYAQYADDIEIPGITAALGCLLHADEINAPAVIAAVRRPAGSPTSTNPCATR